MALILLSCLPPRLDLSQFALDFFAHSFRLFDLLIQVLKFRGCEQQLARLEASQREFQSAGR